MSRTKLHNERINVIVGKLQELIPKTPEYDETFTELYEEVRQRWYAEGALSSLMNKYQLTEDEVLSTALEKLRTAIDNFSDFNKAFYNYLSTCISNECKNLASSKYEVRKIEGTSIEYLIEEEPQFLGKLPHANAEDEAVEFFQKESEQRQLLANLLDKADEKSRQAVEALSKFETFHAAAKQLGISNHAVKRRVRKVAKLYNRNEYGNITDYFTVETESDVKVS